MRAQRDLFLPPHQDATQRAAFSTCASFKTPGCENQLKVIGIENSCWLHPAFFVTRPFSWRILDVACTHHFAQQSEFSLDVYPCANRLRAVWSISVVLEQMLPVVDNMTPAPMTQNCSNCSQVLVPELNVVKAVVLGLLLGVFIVFGIVGNILVILSVVCHRHLRTVTHYFIVNLAVADLLLSATVLPFSAIFEILDRWVLGRVFCNVWAAVDVLCCTASIMSLCVISVDRYIGVSYPLRYPAIVTKHRVLLAVMLLWVLSIIISIGPLFGWKEPAPEDESICKITEEPGYAIFSAVGSFYLPLVIILAMYCRVYVVAHRESQGLKEGQKTTKSDSECVILRIHRGNTTVSEDEALRSRTHFALRLLKFSREKKAAKTLGIVVGCFVLCWLPFFLVLPIGE
ncbi:hypothetical protein LDENG_00060010 [Lucifuga dentata]|nr:hypothetical protein LDENG_00060010 [Lucifuga dentata]